MRIAVMAAGAVGGYFGARLAAAGHDVAFVARGAHLDAMRRNGIKVMSPAGDLTVTDITVTDDPATVGPVDIVLFAVKLWDTETAGAQARALVGPATRVITLQNGVDSAERLAPILGSDVIVAGSAYIGSVISAPGVITHSSTLARIVCGRPDGKEDPILDGFAEAARKGNVDVEVSRQIELELWRKFVFLVAFSGAGAATRHAMGAIVSDPDAKALLHALMRETVAVGRAKGVPLPEDFADDRLRFAQASAPTFRPSMLNDLERGNRLELDWLSGKVAALGRELGVPTPANDAVYAVLKLHRMGRQAAGAAGNGTAPA